MKLPKIDDWTVGEIKDALRKAPDIPSVNATARHFGLNLLALERSKNPEHNTEAIIIRNLAKYRRWELSNAKA